MESTELSVEQVREMQRLKAYFPFRIVYGAIQPETKEWKTAAVTTRHAPNRLAKLGWSVYILQQA